MSLDMLNIFGNPNIGVYLFVNNKVALVPKGVNSIVKDKIREVLDVEVIEARISGSPLLGIFIAGNDRAILLPRIAKESEVQHLKNLGLPVKVFTGLFTALGNVVLTNNRAALLHPELTNNEVSEITSLLGIDRYMKGSIAGVPTVGSAAVITDLGGALHPDVSEEEIKLIEDLFRVHVDIATVNFGVAFIKTGLVANNHGALVGSKTTGPEIMRIMKALNIGE